MFVFPNYSNPSNYSKNISVTEINVKLKMKKLLQKKGMTLVELVVSVTLFSVIAISAFQAFSNIIQVISVSRAKVVAMALANEQFEIIRNLPYADVGIVGGIPQGKVPHTQDLVRSNSTFTVTSTIRNIDDPFDGTLGGSPNDLSPADYKLVELEITCTLCRGFKPVFVNTRVAPKSLETTSSNGALFIRVFNASGQPVSLAQVHVVNNKVNPAIVVDDTTNVSGMLQIVDTPPGTNAYEISVTKSGYISDITYLPGAPSNPNPLQPHATVALQQVTQVSFTIDQKSTMDISTVTQTCSPVASVSFNLKGSRLIGSNPDVLKFNQNYTTDGSGRKIISDLQWDTHNLSLTDPYYDLIGTNPIFPVALGPGALGEVALVVAPINPRSLLVVVKDLATQLPLADANVRLQKTGYDNTLITGLGFISQTNWAGGSGQATSTDLTKYFSSSNVDVANPSGEIKLSNFFGTYDSSGVLISSAFDTGAPNNFNKLFWQPQDQPQITGIDSVKFQIATNNGDDVWNFLGPDGTSGTFYSTSNTNINPIHNGNRYLRYKLYLATANTNVTPNISDISFTFNSSCVPPGQVLFSGLSSGTYTLTISLPGYNSYSAQVSVGSNWQQHEVLLSPL